MLFTDIKRIRKLTVKYLAFFVTNIIFKRLMGIKKIIILKTKAILLGLALTASFTYSQKQWSLKECVDHALENNITVKQNKLSLELAEYDVDIAKGNFLPNLSASTTGNYSEGLSQSNDGVLRNTKNFTSNFDLSSGGTIFNGYKNLNTYKQAQLGIESSKLDLEIISNDISLQVVNTYLNVLFAKENLEAARIQAEISTKQIERSKAQFEAGAIPKGDLLNIRSTAATDTQSVVTQENNLNLALLNLAQLLQISNNGFDVAKIELDAPSSALLYSTSNEVYQKALSNRPEIEKAKLNIKNSDLAIELNKGDYLPSLSYSIGANTSYFHQFNNLDPLRKSPNYYFIEQLSDRFRFDIGLSLNIPIFNRFQTKNRVAKSIINKKQSELAFESEKLALQQTIEQSFLDAKAAAKTFEAAQISLDAQKEAFKNAQASYDYGAMTQFDYDQVRNRLVNAEAAMIRGKYDYYFKTKILQFYYGENIFE